MELEYPGNMHIYTLFPKYLQSFNKFLAAVKELYLQTVHYFIQCRTKTLGSKGQNFAEK